MDIPANGSVKNSGLFESALTITVSAEVTHPPGTTFDDRGNPISPKEEKS